MFTKKFLVDTAERVVFTMAEAALAVLTVDQLSAFDIDWKYLGGISLGAGFYTFLKALAARKRGDSQSASMVQ